jgi:hypothetical protein
MSERDFEYENLNRASDCQYENGIKCKNYELCEAVLPKWAQLTFFPHQWYLHS